MPSRVISVDLKARIPVLRYEQHFEVKEICKILGIRKTTVYKVLQFHREHNSVLNPHADRYRVRRPRMLATSHINFIQKLLNQDKDLYLDEIQDRLKAEYGIRPHVATLSRTLRRLHFSHKKTTPRAIEQDNVRRAIFMNEIGDIAPDPEMLMFTDESAKDERTSSRRYGWSRYGVRCVTRNFFVRGRRFSILPVLSLDGIIAHDIIEGSVTSDIFLKFLRDMVVRL